MKSRWKAFFWCRRSGHEWEIIATPLPSLPKFEGFDGHPGLPGMRECVKCGEWEVMPVGSQIKPPKDIESDVLPVEYVADIYADGRKMLTLTGDVFADDRGALRMWEERKEIDIEFPLGSSVCRYFSIPRSSVLVVDGKVVTPSKRLKVTFEEVE